MDRALKLYYACQTHSEEYRQIARQLAVSTSELNRRCWYYDWVASQLATTSGAVNQLAA